MCALSSLGRRLASVPSMSGAARSGTGVTLSDFRDPLLRVRYPIRFANMSRNPVAEYVPPRGGTALGVAVSDDTSRLMQVRDEDVDAAALVARALAGDTEAYGVLVRRHQGAALRLAAGICGSTEEARDIVQDALVKAHGRLPTWRGEAPVRSWLLRIVA